MVTVLVFRYVTNHHKLNGLKQCPFICSQPCKSVVWSDMTEFFSQCLLRWDTGTLIYSSRCSFKLTGVWQNAGPCGCRAEVPVPFLVVSQRLLSASVGHTHSLSCGPLRLQNQQGRISWASDPCCTLNFCPLLSLISTTLTFRVHMIKSGPPRKSPYLKAYCFGTLISFAKSHHNSTWISIWLKNWEKVYVPQESQGAILEFCPPQEDTWWGRKK